MRPPSPAADKEPTARLNMPGIFLRYLLALIARQNTNANHKSILMGAAIVILWVTAVWRLVQQVQVLIV
jgi:hypothetical protein